MTSVALKEECQIKTAEENKSFESEKLINLWKSKLFHVFPSFSICLTSVALTLDTSAPSK